MDECSLQLPTTGKSRLWDTTNGRLARVFTGHSGWVGCLEWSGDGLTFASGGMDRTIRIWQTKSPRSINCFDASAAPVRNVGWSPDSRTLAAIGIDNSVGIWNIETGKPIRSQRGPRSAVNVAKWSPDGSTIASAGDSKLILLWDATSGDLRLTLEGHSSLVWDLAWLSDGSRILSCLRDLTVRLWDVESGRQLKVLEGHTDEVLSLGLSFDGNVLCSAQKGKVQLWNCNTWDTVVSIDYPIQDWARVALSPSAPILATIGKNSSVIDVWELEGGAADIPARTAKSLKYTTAKIAVIGDAGVGKTGLAWRLVHGEFKSHPSSHGRKFWLVRELGATRADQTECEAVLWDLAGQPDYRLIHALFLNDVDLALVVFDPTNRQDPLKGIEYWLNQLSRAKGQRCPTILVGARLDRGGLTISSEDIDTFCRRHEIAGGYVGTSAQTGDGIPELLTSIKRQINWDEIPTTVTNKVFKTIKDLVITTLARPEVEADDRRSRPLLMSADDLRQYIVTHESDLEFSTEEAFVAVSHVAKHGYVAVVQRSSGEKLILLEPDRLNNLAASFVLEARRDTKGLGALEEAKVMNGGYDFPELRSLGGKER